MATIIRISDVKQISPEERKKDRKRKGLVIAISIFCRSLIKHLNVEKRKFLFLDFNSEKREREKVKL
jgi:hypothetical protein